MTAQDTHTGIGEHGIAAIARRASTLLARLAPRWLTQVALRVALAVPFWRSGIGKWDGFLDLNEIAVLLFSSEFKLHLPGGPYDFPAPATAAFLAGCAEIALPVLLVFGLATRFAALGLLAMTLVIQLTVPDVWPIHLTWAAMALAIIAGGPGRLSVDHLLRRFVSPPR